MSGHPCAERLLLPEALSGRLEPAEEKRVMAHLQTCATCQDAATDIEISLISLAVLRDEQAVPLRTAADRLALTPAASGAGQPGEADGGTDPRLRPPAAPIAPPAAPPAQVAASAQPDAPVAGETGPVVVLSRYRRLPQLLAVAAAAVLFAAGGLLVGHNVLPPRDSTHYGPPVALAPPAGATNRAASGTVAVASDGNTLEVKLNARALPTAGWYECLWVAGGQSRSAGSFRVADGVAKDVELRVAQPQDTTGWDLQVLHHQGTASEVVLEGSAGPQ